MVLLTSCAVGHKSCFTYSTLMAHCLKHKPTALPMYYLLMLPKHTQLIYQPAQEDCTIGDWGIDISASETRSRCQMVTSVVHLPAFSNCTPRKTELHSQHMYTYLQWVWTDLRGWESMPHTDSPIPLTKHRHSHKMGCLIKLSTHFVRVSGWSILHG